jgi:adenylylsulfate kinase
MNGVVVWFTGLPSSGKTTFARKVHALLLERRVPALFLDGDEVRPALRPRPGYDEPAREAFYETLGNLAGLLARQGQAVLVPATAHRNVFRTHARRVAPSFVEVFMDVSAERARAQDQAKELYSRSGKMAGSLPGAGAVYERPLRPEVVAGGSDEKATLEAVFRAVEERMKASPLDDEGLGDVYVGFSVSSIALLDTQAAICSELGHDPRPELHVTVGFLGGVTRAQAETFAVALRPQLPSRTRDPLRVTGLGKAPGEKDEEVAWLALEPDERLLAVREKTVAVLREQKLDRFVRPEFYPHITLGSRGPGIWDRHDLPKTANVRSLALEVSPEAFHVTSVGMHPVSLIRL